MRTEISEEKLTAYLLGELDETERKAIETAVQGDASMQKTLSEMRGAVELSAKAFDEPAPLPIQLTDEQHKKINNKVSGDSPFSGPFETVPFEEQPSESGAGVIASAKGSLFGAPGGGAAATKTAPVFALEGGLFGDGAKSARDPLKRAGKPAFSAVTTSVAKQSREVFGSASATGGQTKPSDQGRESQGFFSLANLESLSTRASAPQEPIEETIKNEESGLIDIRSLAGTLSTREFDQIDDLISLDSAGALPQFGAPILPQSRRGLKSLTRFLPWAGGVAILALIAVVTTVLLRDRDESLQQRQLEKLSKLESQLDELTKKSAEGENSAQIQALAQQIAQEKTRTKPMAEEVTTGTQAEEVKPVQTARSSGDKERKRESSSGVSETRSASASRGASKKASAEKDEPAELSSVFRASEEPEVKPKKSTKDLDSLLGVGTNEPKDRKRSRSGSSDGEGGGGLPKTLTRSQVQNGLNGVAGPVKRCGQGTKGAITINVTIGKNGSVISANATGAFSGTPIGMCCARAVKKAQFPKFSGSNINVKYPFKL